MQASLKILMLFANLEEEVLESTALLPD